MIDSDGYRDGTALWSAAVARARMTAKQRGVEPASVLRGFVFDRFLARVFTPLPGRDRLCARRESGSLDA